MSAVIQGTFETRDPLKLFYRFYPSDSPSADLLILLHGHGEHSGRYEKFAKILKDENLSIAVFDYRGHGRSGGPPVYLNEFEDYVRDVTCFVEHLEKAHQQNRPFFILGHSLGGLVAIYWTLNHLRKVKGLILSSPCLGLRLPEFLVRLNQLLCKIAPHFCYKNPVYPPHLSHNPEEVLNYKKDSLIQRRMSTRLLSEMMTAMRKLETIPQFDFPFPVFILMAGELEKVVDARKTKLFFDKVQAPLKDMKVFQGFYHEIFNEIKQEEAFGALKTAIRQIRLLS